MSLGKKWFFSPILKNGGPDETEDESIENYLHMHLQFVWLNVQLIMRSDTSKLIVGTPQFWG